MGKSQCIPYMTLTPINLRQAYADHLAAAGSAEEVCTVVQELFQKEDIPYGAPFFS